MPLSEKTVRLISPTGRRITTVTIGSSKSMNLSRLGWRLYTGPGEASEGFDGRRPGQQGVFIDPGKDPRNGWLIPESDPKVIRAISPAGSWDFNPKAVSLL